MSAGRKLYEEYVKEKDEPVEEMPEWTDLHPACREWWVEIVPQIDDLRTSTEDRIVGMVEALARRTANHVRDSVQEGTHQPRIHLPPPIRLPPPKVTVRPDADERMAEWDRERGKVPKKYEYCVHHGPMVDVEPECSSPTHDWEPEENRGQDDPALWELCSHCRASRYSVSVK